MAKKTTINEQTAPIDVPEGFTEVLVTAGMRVITGADLKQGDRFEGTYVGAVARTSRFGPVKLHVLSLADGVGLVGLWGTYALDEALGRVGDGMGVILVCGADLDLDDGARMRLWRAWTNRTIDRDAPTLSEAERVAEAEGVFEALGLDGAPAEVEVLDAGTGEYRTVR